MKLNSSHLHVPKYKTHIKELATGSTGWVFEVKKDKGHRDKLALKVLRPDLCDEKNITEIIRSMKKEAKRMQNNKHESLVSVHDFGMASYRGLKMQLPFIVMEWVEGYEFDEWFRNLTVDDDVKFTIYLS